MTLLFSVNTVSPNQGLPVPNRDAGPVVQAAPDIELAVEMARVLARAGLMAPESSRSAADQISDWATDYRLQHETAHGRSSPFQSAPENMSASERDAMHHYTFQRAAEAGWSGYDKVLSPAMSVQEQRIARVHEAQRYARLGAGSSLSSSVEMELLESELTRHLCCEVLRSLGRGASLQSGRLELRPAGSNYAELVHQDIVLLFVDISAEERQHPGLALKIVTEALTREVSSYLCDEGLVNKAIEALRAQPEGSQELLQMQADEFRQPIRSTSSTSFCL
jgi:hypothetical protein